MIGSQLQRTMVVGGKKIHGIVPISITERKGRWLTGHPGRRVTFTDGTFMDVRDTADVPNVAGYRESFAGEQTRTNPYQQAIRIRANDGKWRGESNGPMGTADTRLTTRQHDQITRMPGWGRTLRDERTGQ